MQNEYKQQKSVQNKQKSDKTVYIFKMPKYDTFFPE